MDVTRRWVEQAMVIEDYTMAKVFSSVVYRTMWRNYGHEMYQCLFTKFMKEKEINTHTHTHAEEKFCRGGHRQCQRSQ